MLRRFGSHLRDQWIGTLALFLVLGGGTAYAVTQIDRNSVKSKHIVNGQVKSADIGDNAVSRAALEDNSVGEAELADDAVQQAQGAVFVSAGLTDVSGIFDPETESRCGEFTGGWANYAPSNYGEVGYARDSSGFVHLRGLAIECGAPGATVFTLPVGFRPEKDELFNPGANPIDVRPSGAVDVSSSGDEYVAVLNGLYFRCAPSGQNGCP